MQRQFEIEIEQIKQTVLTMAGLAEKSLEDVSRALIERDSDLARAVIDLDDEIDRHEVLIDQLTAEFIVRHQPTAVDLRFVLVAIKLGPELERIADNAVNIAQRVLHLNARPPVKPLIDLPRMLAVARAMVSDSISAFVARDTALAREVIRRDDEVDALYVQIFRELLTFMMEDPSTITRALDLIFTARFAERVADQATNIAEEVVYLAEAQNIRHTAIDGGERKHKEEFPAD
jgi:phosphate transport system protein